MYYMFKIILCVYICVWFVWVLVEYRMTHSTLYNPLKMLEITSANSKNIY